MAETYKVLGQVKSVANTPTTVYEALSYVSVSSMLILNTLSSSATYSIYAKPSGQTLDLQLHAIIHSKTISAGEHHEVTGSIALSAGDSLIISSSSDFLAMSIFGVEIS